MSILCSVFSLLLKIDISWKQDSLQLKENTPNLEKELGKVIRDFTKQLLVVKNWVRIWDSTEPWAQESHRCAFLQYLSTLRAWGLLLLSPALFVLCTFSSVQLQVEMFTPEEEYSDLCYGLPLYLLSVHPNQTASVPQLSKDQSECCLLKHHIVTVKRQKASAKTGFLPKVHCRFSLCGWSICNSTEFCKGFSSRVGCFCANIADSGTTCNTWNGTCYCSIFWGGFLDFYFLD